MQSDASSRHRPAQAADHGKVILFYPKAGVDIPGVTVFLPLSVIFPAVALEEAGYSVIVIDQRIDQNWRKRLADELREGCVFLGISAMTGPQIKWGLRAAEVARETAPETVIVWGGIHPSILPEETLSDDRVDSVVAGKGEEVAVEIADALAGNGGSRVIGRVHESPSRSRPAGCTLRQPNVRYDTVPWREYVTPVTRGTRGLAHVTSRGCPHRCSYCYNRSVNGSRWRGRPAPDVVEDLARLHRLGSEGVLLFEDNFFANRSRVEEVARELVARGIRLKIKADCRADYVLTYDPSFLRLLKQAGFEVLFVGVESGSDRVLKMIRKDITVADSLEANRRLARAGIKPHYSFMAGLPGETERDIYATVRLMRRLKKEHPGALIAPVKGYVPYPGTTIFDKAVEMGFEPPRSLSGWSRFDWNGSPRPWLTRKQALLVEKATYLTMGIDTDLAEDFGLRRRPLLWKLYRLYARICRKRCERREFGPVPELHLLRLVKRIMSTA